MKNCKLIILFILFNNYLNVIAQTISAECNGVEIPYAGSVSSSITCNSTSSAWLNKYSKVSTYTPTINSPINILHVNFIIIQDDNFGNNFLNNLNDRATLEQIFNWMRNVYLSNDQASDPIPGVTYLPQKYIDFTLDGIYFYQNTSLNNSTNGYNMINFISSYFPARLKSLNIFFTEGGQGWAHATRGVNYNNTDDLWINMLGVWSGSPGSNYASSVNLAHEMGHCLDLCHTYVCSGGGCGCFSSLSQMGIDPDNGDYFDDVFGLPIPGNAPHYKPNDPPINPNWGYDTYLSFSDKITNNLMGGFQAEQYLSPLQIAKMHRALKLKSAKRYLANCIYNSTNPWYINSTEEWDFDVLWDRDIVIQGGAVVSLTCKLSMPQTSSITVES